MEKFNLQTSRTNEKKETIQKFDNIDLKIEYFWNSHGKLVKWKESADEWSNVNVEIILYSFTENISDNAYDFVSRQLLVDGKYVISGDLFDAVINKFGNKTTLYCRVVVGWG
jgi:hypothetical protein